MPPMLAKGCDSQHGEVEGRVREAAEEAQWQRRRVMREVYL